MVLKLQKGTEPAPTNGVQMPLRACMCDLSEHGCVSVCACTQLLTISTNQAGNVKAGNTV